MWSTSDCPSSSLEWRSPLTRLKLSAAVFSESDRTPPETPRAYLCGFTQPELINLISYCIAS
ncbi:hypothetical protein PQG02_24610 [Nostoc sp. UHCC 0926]|uniref:hypothetical protein n=1 Tax=unclassified Nostoc TaxID=2593658 RepID=UPI002361AD59|nr:hypothetical protein [Nostoc sp. UHCC 0926]WDD31837.1 hypothetical protein PQG02_24610 [Nostoc sp. UHCC 0926]